MCPWIRLDFGFKIIHGFGFAFSNGFKSKSENPKPYSSTVQQVCLSLDGRVYTTQFFFTRASGGVDMSQP